jgi:hypothetical protein
LPKYPRGVQNPIGGLTSNQNPIICGGIDDRTVIADCFFYSDGIWNRFPSMTYTRVNAAVAPFTNPTGAHSLLVIGGSSDIVDSKTGEYMSDGGWQELNNFFTLTMKRHCMVTINSTTVLIIGGVQRAVWDSPNTFYFNTENEMWVPGPTLSFGRSSHTCGMVKKERGSLQESIIVAGGNNGTDMTSVEILDIGTHEWRTGPELPIPIKHASMVDHPFGGLVLIGGYGAEEWQDSLYLLPFANSEWVLMPQKLNFTRSDAVAFLVPDDITSCN